MIDEISSPHWIFSSDDFVIFSSFCNSSLPFITQNTATAVCPEGARAGLKHCVTGNRALSFENILGPCQSPGIVTGASRALQNCFVCCNLSLTYWQCEAFELHFFLISCLSVTLRPPTFHVVSFSFISFKCTRVFYGRRHHSYQFSIYIILIK